MSVARVKALRGLQSALRSSNVRAVPRVSVPARTQLAVGRRWASGGEHGHAEPSSDTPWLIGAIVITIPSCWYLWPTSNAHAEHGSHDDDGVHRDEDSPKEEDESSQEQGEEKDAEEVKKTEEKGSTQSEAEDAGVEGSTGDEGADQQSAQSDDQTQSKASDSAQQSKGKVAGDSAANTETRKVEDDSKGAKKKRVDSGFQKDLGPSSETHGDDETTDKAAPAKPSSGDSGDISSKQAGMSNTPTRHSTKIDEDSEKSKKAEGGPDTAKVMGTVDPSRPAK